MLRHVSLRARLVLGVIVLAALGLLAADVATYTSLRSFLFDRTDATLESVERGVGHPGFAGSGPGQQPVFVQWRTANGARVLRTLSPPAFVAASPPSLPATVSLAGAKRHGPELARSFVVPARSGGDRYRVRASLDPRSGQMLVISISLHDVDGTLHRLLLIEALVTAAVLAALAALGLWVVRLGLRPLRAIEATAAAIAAGDLGQRVERAEERTEVGRLGLALNAMLGQIEAAFRAREATERKLRRFVADASHELRTPLAAVRAYAELFERGAAQRPDDLARSLAGISRESERMTVLVEDLLLLARLDEGRPLEREPVRLDELAAEAVETARTVEPERPLDLDAEAVTVLGDATRLRQVVDNLLANVRSHTPASAPAHLRVRAADGEAVLEVADEGPGLEPEELEQVFERFYRSDGSRSRASGGVGLGLAIVAAVAQAHGGRVEARSEPGHGATFGVRLPLA